MGARTNLAGKRARMNLFLKSLFEAYRRSSAYHCHGFISIDVYNDVRVQKRSFVSNVYPTSNNEIEYEASVVADVFECFIEYLVYDFHDRQVFFERNRNCLKVALWKARLVYIVRFDEVVLLVSFVRYVTFFE